MKYLITLMLFFLPTLSIGQMKSDFIILEDTTGEQAVIYQGACSFDDLKKIDAFNALNEEDHAIENKVLLSQIASKIKTFDIIIFLGTWCEDSHVLVPPFYRLLMATEFPLSQLQMVALDRSKKGRAQEEELYNVTQIPTFIFLKDNKEYGRIVESVTVDLLHDIHQIISK
jgi:thiol-disulfide isomerase/thioredoxin